ncbi:hydroxysqualene dehydroxylase HpnE [Paraburkholderia caballeronis]|uniref:hydroxysqualene dehydroxylase HpnE n=1 Tax=Paraburkholderia caballeronis TaxID=416943 RepID=UPI001066FCF2|nr:hydroxysqualene dehydroxylase HpnE [Paraburkholderia caballeronis]TDV05096.1 squalene-associated FAD-dependent desaturase [Paraburkholderia caballeronis]TDV08209.1 squalene-associated FAD-dependent desaturase [Paraburkholderia caballeronis]TDV19223.1 squalene-associated FAD-dependent desaturase [Paraburkholderia caballeronis]
MPRLVHVVGAGLAGLAAAVQLQRRGVQVTLHEAAGHAGGRCRSYYDRTLGATVDSGNHVVMSGSHATLDYVRTIGAADELAGPERAEYAFVDLAVRARWTLRVSNGRLPLWAFDPNARVPGTRAADYLSLLPLWFAKPGRTLAQTMRCEGVLWNRLWRPFLLAALNVEPRDASAELAAAFVRETFVAGGEACRPLVARNGVGSAFVDPALRMLQHGGAAIRLNAPLKSIAFDSASPRVAALHFDDGPVALGANEAVVLAVPPDAARALVPDVETPRRASAIVNVHFAAEPPTGLGPLTMLVNGTAGRLFGLDGRLSATIGGADALADLPPDELARRVWADVAGATSLPADPMPTWQVATERQATFAALPDEELRRPATRTRWNNLMLAGDWTATGLPATIEGAIRSGRKAADRLLTVPLERR